MLKEAASPSLFLALLPLALLVALLVINVALFADEATAGPNQIALLLAAGFAALLGRYRLALPYQSLERGAIHSVGLAMQANLILLTVGALIGLWIMAGIVPTLIYYGIKIINPSVFLLVACVTCSVVSLSIGSSWSTMGTVGVALIGIGTTLGLSLPMVAGAIISGAYFGDKLSPLSDTTNLAPAVAGTNLFTHVRHLLYTTLPAYALTLIAFTVLGFSQQPDAFDVETVNTFLTEIEGYFNIGIHTLLAPVIVFALVMLKVPALPALAVGAMLGAGEALLFQRQLFVAAPDAPFVLRDAYVAIMQTAFGGFASATGNEILDDLFSRGGMLGMLNTVFLIISAMVFGGVMETAGMLRTIADALLRLVRGTGSLVGATVGTCILFNLTASDQYLSIVVPGRMFRQAYAARNLAACNLSRALEDGGTVTSVMVPWNTCGAYASVTLGVPTAAYMPYCIFNWLCPIVSVTLAAFHIGIAEGLEDSAPEENSPPL